MKDEEGEGEREGWNRREKRGRLFKSQAHPCRIHRYLEKVSPHSCNGHNIYSMLAPPSSVVVISYYVYPRKSKSKQTTRTAMIDALFAIDISPLSLLIL